jgi:hypothetical protein
MHLSGITTEGYHFCDVFACVILAALSRELGHNEDSDQTDPQDMIFSLKILQEKCINIEEVFNIKLVNRTKSEVR